MSRKLRFLSILYNMHNCQHCTSGRLLKIVVPVLGPVKIRGRIMLVTQRHHDVDNLFTPKVPLGLTQLIILHLGIRGLSGVRTDCMGLCLTVQARLLVWVLALGIKRNLISCRSALCARFRFLETVSFSRHAILVINICLNASWILWALFLMVLLRIEAVLFCMM